MRAAFSLNRIHADGTGVSPHSVGAPFRSRGGLLSIPSACFAGDILADGMHWYTIQWVVVSKKSPLHPAASRVSMGGAAWSVRGEFRFGCIYNRLILLRNDMVVPLLSPHVLQGISGGSEYSQSYCKLAGYAIAG